jgi:DNA mismatch endonuclease (patch repair protein)
MKANRKRDTGPELRLRSLLHRRGLRFRVNLEVDMPGLKVRPDIVFPRNRVAAFVDGHFWHSCRWHGTQPRSNSHYWRPKLERVVRRDRKVKTLLRKAGWTVLRLWEHVPAGKAADLVARAIVVA